MDKFFNDIHFDKVELKPVYQIFRQNNLLYKKKKKKP